MSSFLKSGKRKEGSGKRRETSKHIKNFYKILHDLDIVATKMIESGIIINEDNVIQEASKYTTRKIEGYEKMILLGKTGQVYDSLKPKK